MNTVPTTPHAEIVVCARTEDEAVDYLVQEFGLGGDAIDLAPIPPKNGLLPFRFVNLEPAVEIADQNDPALGCTGVPTKPAI